MRRTAVVACAPVGAIWKFGGRFRLLTVFNNDGRHKPTTEHARAGCHGRLTSP